MASNDKSQSKGEKKKRELTPLDLRYLKAVGNIIANGLATDEKDFSSKIGFEKSTISRMKSTGRGASLNQIHATITQFDLNANYFFKNDDALFSWEVKKPESGSKTYGNATTHGDNSPVVNGDNLGTIKSKYEQIADTIYNQHAPPELENQIHTLVNLTRDIKKINDDFEVENGALKQEVKELKGIVAVKDKELVSVKDELLDVYREKRKKA